MTQIEKLLIEWNKELNDIESMRLKSIENSESYDMMHHNGRKIQLISCIGDLKNLPNESKTVNRNEQASEVCPECGDNEYSQYNNIQRSCLSCATLY